MKNITLPIVIEGDTDGYFVSCPALQGCYSQGDTYEEAVENIKDAIRLHIEDRLADGEEIRKLRLACRQSKSACDGQAPAANSARNLHDSRALWIFGCPPEGQSH